MGVPHGTTVFDKRTPGLDFIYGVPRATDKTIEALANNLDVKAVLEQADVVDAVGEPGEQSTTAPGLPDVKTSEDAALLDGGARPFLAIVLGALALVSVTALVTVLLMRRRCAAGQLKEGDQ
jgi:hypothetical protein